MSLINSLLNAPQPCFDNHLTQAGISFSGRLLSSNTNHHKVQRVSNSYSIQWYPRSCFLDWSQNEIKSPSLSQTETRPSKNAVDSEPRPSKSGLGTSADLEYYNAIGSTTRDLVFSASFENNYTYCICCSVWFALASLKDSQGKALGRKRTEIYSACLLICLGPAFFFRQPQEARKLGYFEPRDKDQLESDIRYAKKNPILHKGFQRSATSVIECGTPIKWSKPGACKVNENK